MVHARVVFPVLLLWALGCTTYEYEEEVYVELDGSGSIRVSGSVPVLRAIFGDAAGADSPSSFRRLFEAEGLTVESVRETERGGRRYLHFQGSFAAWSELCRLPALRGRDCSLDVGEESVRLRISVPAPEAPAPASLEPEARIAYRFHFPSTVRYHNSPAPVQRGNILEWERTVREHFGGPPVAIEARFARESVLLATARVLGLALGAVVVLVVSAIAIMVRKGRRQLALGRRPPAPSKTR